MLDHDRPAVKCHPHTTPNPVLGFAHFGEGLRVLQRTEHFRVCQEGRIDALPYWARERQAYPARPHFADVAFDQGTRIHVHSRH